VSPQHPCLAPLIRGIHRTWRPSFNSSSSAVYEVL
jgi:hypothetical protein